jgi:hypothetical protein
MGNSKGLATFKRSGTWKSGGGKKPTGGKCSAALTTARRPAGGRAKRIRRVVMPESETGDDSQHASDATSGTCGTQATDSDDYSRVVMAAMSTVGPACDGHHVHSNINVLTCMAPNALARNLRSDLSHSTL